ncbi:MAG: hypothetical protein QOE69_1635 [Thermoleophilaceae bacterium]|jgi:hypothetical protein|nr:hypothetical protein [Thermoleophilaceae bacterium]
MELHRAWLVSSGREVIVLFRRKFTPTPLERAEALMQQAQETGRSNEYDEAFRAFRALPDDNVATRRRLAEYLAADGERYVQGFREKNLLRPHDPAPSPRARELFEEALELDPTCQRARRGLAQWDRDNEEVESSWRDPNYGKCWCNGRPLPAVTSGLPEGARRLVTRIDHLVDRVGPTLREWRRAYDEVEAERGGEHRAPAREFRQLRDRLAPIAIRLVSVDLELHELAMALSRDPSLGGRAEVEADALIGDISLRAYWLGDGPPKITGDWVASTPETGPSYSGDYGTPPPRSAGYSTRRRKRP